MTNFFRRMVAGTRRRLEEDGYDLDLTYIIPNRIIAMSYPASSFESMYRNPINKVCLFTLVLATCCSNRVPNSHMNILFLFYRYQSFFNKSMATNTISSIHPNEPLMIKKNTLVEELASITGQIIMDPHSTFSSK